MARPQAADYEDRKELIVDRAARLFASKSFLGTSITDIARACNFSKSLLYHYYDSKETLLAAVMSSHIDRLEEIVEEIVAGPGTPCERLRLLLRRFMTEYANAASKQKVLLNELAHLPESESRMIVRKQRRIVENVQELLTQCKEGLGSDHGRARASTMLLFGMINWTSNWYNPSGSLRPHEIADMASDLLIGT